MTAADAALGIARVVAFIAEAVGTDAAGRGTVLAYRDGAKRDSFLDQKID